MKKSLALVAAVMAPVSLASAQDWSGEGELGYISSDSDTASNDTFTLKARLGRETEHWRHTAKAEAIYAESTEDGVESKSADRRFLSWKSDRKLGKKHYIYGLVSYESDAINSIDYRTNESVGYGNRLLQGPVHLLDLEIGAGARQSEINGVRDDEGVLRLAADYRYNFSDNAHFTEEFSHEHGTDTRITRSVTGLSAKINNSLASKLSYTRQRTESDAATLNESIVAATLVYSF